MRRSFIRQGLLGMTVLTFISCGALFGQEEDASALFERGLRYYQQSNFVASSLLVNQAIQAGYFEVDAYFTLANSYLATERYTDALFYYKQALYISHTSNARAIILHNMGYAHFLAGDYLLAKDYLDQAEAEDPSLSSLYLRRGFVHLQLHQTTNAIQDFKRYLEMEPDAPQAEELQQALTRLETDVEATELFSGLVDNALSMEGLATNQLPEDTNVWNADANLSEAIHLANSTDTNKAEVSNGEQRNSADEAAGAATESADTTAAPSAPAPPKEGAPSEATNTAPTTSESASTEATDAASEAPSDEKAASEGAAPSESAEPAHPETTTTNTEQAPETSSPPSEPKEPEPGTGSYIPTVLP